MKEVGDKRACDMSRPYTDAPGTTTGAQRLERRGRRQRAAGLIAALAFLASGLALLGGTGTAGAQLSPCQGGPGECVTSLDFSLGFSFTGTGTCEWTIDINWGDGTSETQVLVVTGTTTRSIPHRYPGFGLYTVDVDGSGQPIGGTDSCTFSDFSLQVEIVDAGRTCLGQPATMVGTSGPDTLRGTAGPDVILGLGGNDDINGLGGNDRICGGPGNDTLVGAGGVDGILGGPGRDIIRGGAATDVLNGQGGRDRIIGQGGPDVMFGGGGNDVLDGGGGNDVMRGNGGDDRLRGRAGRDTLNGGAGNDACIGGAGRDRLRNCER